jgi:predicted O-methyltransferase YrrM
MNNLVQGLWKYVPGDQRVRLRRMAQRAKRRLSPPEVNPLEEYFLANEGRLIHKWSHYFDVYHRHLAKLRGKRINVLEFGVSHGGSLQMWKHYFGRRAHITGVDIKSRSAQLAEDRVDIVIGDQSDRKFLRRLGQQLGEIDVLIEDGGHTMEQQIATFEELWPRIRIGGVLAMEDLHTSYWNRYGGGLKQPGTFIEYAKDLIDKQHAWHIPGTEPDDYTRSIAGMHVYNSIIVFDKGVVTKPGHPKTGHPSF